MPIFGVEIETIETDTNVKISNFMQQSNERLQGKSFVKNPYNGSILRINKETWVVDMEPVYPPYYWLGLIYIFISLLMAGFTPWILPGVLLFMFGIFWSKAFTYTMLVLGLRKAGYKGPTKLIRNSRLIKRIMRINYCPSSV